MKSVATPHVSVIGGSGKLGGAIAKRLARAGYAVVIGSRQAARADEAALRISAAVGQAVESAMNVEAAARGDIVILAVPYSSHEATLREIAPALVGKILMDTTVPLAPPAVMEARLPFQGSAAQAAQALLGEATRVVSAFHNVAAHKLAGDDDVDCDVLVFGDDREARTAVVPLITACGLQAIQAGALANSAAAEALTSVLIFINRHYSVDGAGIRITGALQGGGTH